MNFSTQLIEVFDYLGSKIGMAIDWTNQNVAPYLEELVKTSIWILISIIIISACIYSIKFVKYLWNQYLDNTYSSYDMDSVLLGVFIFIIFSIFVGIFIEQILYISKCIIYYT